MLQENTEQEREIDLIKLITWAVDRILKYQYELTWREDGDPDVLELGDSLGPGRALTPDERERVVEAYLVRCSSPGALASFRAVREARTPEQLAAFLKILFDPAEASLAFEDLKGAAWQDIVMYIDSYFFQGSHVVEKIGRTIVKEREGFSSPFGRELEAFLAQRVPTGLDPFAARKYAAEFKELLPKVVKRATAPEFRLLAAARNVPESVKRYLIEASCCYLYGCFLACLVVCRSAVEEAVKQRLIDIGKKAEDDRLKALLRLARSEGLLDSKRFQMAEGIRERARKAVHGKELPDDPECIESFHQTRGVLEHLYGRLQ